MKTHMLRTFALLLLLEVAFTLFACATVGGDSESNDKGVVKLNTTRAAPPNAPHVTTIVSETTTRAPEIVTATEEIRTEPETVYEAYRIPINDSDTRTKTETPVIEEQTNTSPTTICIAGSCEMYSEIIIRGGLDDVKFKSDFTYFIGTVEVPKVDDEIVLSVTAQTEGKAESDTVEVKAKYKKYSQHIRTDAFEVIVGSDSQCHFVTALEDYENTNKLKDAQVKSLTKRIKSRVDFLNTEMNGTELIYVIVPNSMTVYPETVPAKYSKGSGTTRTQQFIEAVTEGGAKVIDTTAALLSHKGDVYKLFHKTDSHWTEYGAWIAYTELFNYISKKFPDAKPRTEDEMGFYLDDVNGGDMPYYLEFDCEDVRELAVFANPFIDMPTRTLKFISKGDLLMNHDTTPKENYINTKRYNLPSAYVMRDSYGIAMYDMLAERFNATTYKAMWQYDFNEDDIKASKADYVIYIVAERTLGEVIY